MEEEVQEWKKEHGASFTSGPSPSPPLDWDCVVRGEAYSYAKTLLGGSGRGLGLVYAAFNASECNLPTPESVADLYASSLLPDHDRLLTQLPKEDVERRSSVRSGRIRRKMLPMADISVESRPTFYVDPVNGDDSAVGSENAPWKTLERTMQYLESRQSAGGALFLLNNGTYNLEHSLNFGGVSGGVNGDVVEYRVQNEWTQAVLSGAKELTHLDWSAGSGGQYCTPVNGQVLDQITDLLVNGSRAQAARWPNGNVLNFCNPYEEKCSDVVTPKGSGPRVVGYASSPPLNVQSINQQTRNVLELGAFSSGGAQNFTIDVADQLGPEDAPFWPNASATCSSYSGYTGPNVARYNATLALPFWNSSRPLSFIYNPATWTKQTWSRPTEIFANVLHPSGWGGWAFQVGSINTHTNTIDFSAGGFQEARGGSGMGPSWFENIMEELDAVDEFYHDLSTDTMCYIPPSGANLNATTFSVPQLTQLAVIPEGSGYVRFTGVTFTGTRRTFMDEEGYFVPSGGDYSIYYGAAVMVEGGDGVQIDDCFFNEPGGNAVFITGGAQNTQIVNTEFAGIGDNAIAVVGVCELYDCRAPTQPNNTIIQHNFFHQWGVVDTQSAAVFHAVARSTQILYNIAFVAPRAAININDETFGNTNTIGNLVFDTVLRTQDHAGFNSWGRSALLWNDEVTGKPRTISRVNALQNNFFFRHSYFGSDSCLYAYDHDDGSNRFEHTSNIAHRGSVKFRDGRLKKATDVLVIYPEVEPYAAAFQVNAFGTETWVGNTLVSATGQAYGFCASMTPHSPRPLTANNTYITPGDSSLPWNNGGCGGQTVKSLKEWQQLGWDAGSTQVSDYTKEDLAADIQKRLKPQSPSPLP